MKQIFLLFFLLTCTHVKAQNFDITFFERTGGDFRSEIDKNLKEYKKIKKENEQWLKDQEERYALLQDSLNQLESTDSLLTIIGKDSIESLKKHQKEYYLYTDSIHGLGEIMSWDKNKLLAKDEIKSRSKEVLNSNAHYKKYSSLNSDLISYQKEFRQYKDSLKKENLQSYKEDYLLEKKRKELAEKYNHELESFAEKELKRSERLTLPASSPEMERLKEINKLSKAATMPDENMVNSALESEDFFADKSEALQGAVEKTNELKEKYSEVTNAADLSGSIKRNSLKGKKLVERIAFGGNFQIRIDEQTAVDINPELQYLITKKWSAGLGASYRANGELIKVQNDFTRTQVYGYRALTEYFLVSNFYAHLEFESLSSSLSSENQKWYNSVLAGIESQFKIRGKLKGQVSILYNFMHETNPLNDQAWNVRFGLSSTLR